MLVHIGFTCGFVFLVAFALQMRMLHIGYSGAFVAMKHQIEAPESSETTDTKFVVKPLINQPEAPSQLPVLLAFAGFAVAWAGYAVKGS